MILSFRDFFLILFSRQNFLRFNSQPYQIDNLTIYFTEFRKIEIPTISETALKSHFCGVTKIEENNMEKVCRYSQEFPMVIQHPILPKKPSKAQREICREAFSFCSIYQKINIHGSTSLRKSTNVAFLKNI